MEGLERSNVAINARESSALESINECKSLHLSTISGSDSILAASSIISDSSASKQSNVSEVDEQ